MTFTRREKSENENGFRRFRRAKTPEKAFSGNYTFSARESAQVPVLQGERAETKRGLTAIAIRPRDKLGGGASGIRTRDPYVANVMLYQLSYSPKFLVNALKIMIQMKIASRTANFSREIILCNLPKSVFLQNVAIS